MLKEFAKNSLLKVYTLSLFSPFRARVQKKKITILLYHEIDSQRLQDHLTFLTRANTPIDIDLLHNALAKRNSDVLPDRSFLVTFDDGWKSNIQILPVIRKLNIRPTIFLTAGLVDTNRKIWNYIDNGNLRKNHRLNEKIKKLPNKEKNHFLIEKYNYHVEKEFNQRDMLTRNEIRQMLPHVDFQSHGMFHPVFPMCTDQELEFELTQSKKIIESITGKPCYAIAYPYGACRNREIRAAEAAGYRIGRIANQPGLNSVSTNPMLLKSVGIDGCFDCAQLEKSLAWAEIKTISANRYDTHTDTVKKQQSRKSIPPTRVRTMRTPAGNSRTPDTAKRSKTAATNAST